MFAKENQKKTNTKRSWSDISQGEFTKNMGQCSGANFASFCFLCQYNSISVLTLFVFVFSANYARSWTWPCNCCSLSYQFSRVSCFFFRFVFCFSSYIIGKWQCQKLVAFPICHSLFPVASCQLLCAANAALTILENSFVLVIDKWEASGTVSTFLHFHIFN